MMETAIVAAVMAVSLLLTHLRRLSETYGGLFAALALVTAGALVSVTMGAVYHVALWRTLGARGLLPRGWYWSPNSHHHALTASERYKVLPWFYVGAAGFVMVVLGALMVLLAVYVGPAT